MPNGYGNFQVYVRSEDHDILEFVHSLGWGERSQFVVEAIRLKRSLGEETAEVSAMRRVVREELERWAGQPITVTPPPAIKDEDRAAIDKVFGNAVKAWGAQ